MTETETYYFVCANCAAIEPFPEAADYTRCGNCGSSSGQTCQELDDAEELSQAQLDAAGQEAAQ